MAVIDRVGAPKAIPIFCTGLPATAVKVWDGFACSRCGAHVRVVW